jgi:alpha-galactosidase
LELVKGYARRFRDWGYRLIKHDFTTYDITGKWGFQKPGFTNDGWSFRDEGKTTAEVVLDLYRSLREGAGDAYLLGCNTFSHLAAGLVEIQRTGDDTSGKEWERTRKMGINTVAFRLPQHNAFYAADADCVGITENVPWRLNNDWLELVTRSGTPLFISADPNAMGPEQREAVASAFKLAANEQPQAEPMDWQDNASPAMWRFGDEEKVFNWTDTTRVPYIGL